MTTAHPSRWIEALAAATLAVALLASESNLSAIAREHAAAMRCGEPAPDLACKLLCWMAGR